MKRVNHWLFAASLAFALAAGKSARGGGPVTFILTSPEFTNGAEIPMVRTCEGKDSSPPLAWSDAPKETKSFALVVDDPDAPDPKAAKKMTWVHWVIYNIPASARSLHEAATRESLPKEAAEGLNDWKKPGYGGPCPPVGRHRYVFKLYALDTHLEGLKGPTKSDLEAAMQGHVLGKAELVGTYEKKHK